MILGCNNSDRAATSRRHFLNRTKISHFPITSQTATVTPSPSTLDDLYSVNLLEDFISRFDNVTKPTATQKPHELKLLFEPGEMEQLEGAAWRRKQLTHLEYLVPVSLSGSGS